MAATTTMTMLPRRAAAARPGILGVSTDSLRERLQRGPTPGRKVDGSWRVAVPDMAPGRAEPVPAGTAHRDRPGRVEDEQGAPHTEPWGADFGWCTRAPGRPRLPRGRYPRTEAARRVGPPPPSGTFGASAAATSTATGRGRVRMNEYPCVPPGAVYG